MFRPPLLVLLLLLCSDLGHGARLTSEVQEAFAHNASAAGALGPDTPAVSWTDVAAAGRQAPSVQLVSHAAAPTRRRWVRTAAALAPLLFGAGASAYAPLRPGQRSLLRAAEVPRTSYVGSRTAPFGEDLAPASARRRPTLAAQSDKDSEFFLSLPASWDAKLSEDLCKIGEGCTATIFKGHVKGTNTNVALKVIRINSEDKVKATDAEIKAMQAIGGGDILALFDISLTVDEDGVPSGFLLLEAADGTLASMLRRWFPVMTTENKVRILVELLRALNRVSDAGYVHRDIKPENVFVFGDAEAPDGFHVKLGDFGSAEPLQELRKKPTLAGTRWYMAPEVWTGIGDMAKSDIWSAGVLAYTIFLGAHPRAFYEPALDQETANIFEDPLRDFIPMKFDITQDEGFQALTEAEPDVAELIRGMLRKEARSRFDARKALMHAQKIAHSRGIHVPERAKVSLPDGWFSA